MKELSNIEIDTVGRIKNFVRKLKIHKKANKDIENLTKKYFNDVSHIITQYSKLEEAMQEQSRKEQAKQRKLERKEIPPQEDSLDMENQ